MNSPTETRPRALPPSFREYREAAVAASLPTTCGFVFAVTAVYAASQWIFRPEVFQAASAFIAVQVAVPVVAWLVNLTSLRRHAQRIALAADLIYTASLSAQMLVPQTNVSGIALFIAVKLLATALFFPWSARTQYASAGATVVLYWVLLAATDKPVDPSARLHQVLGPVIAGVLAAAGAGRAERVRRELYRRDAEREELVGRLQMILDRMPIGCVISDVEFRYTYWNPAAEAIFGYQLAEVRGKHPFELIIPEETRDQVGDAIQRLVAGEPLGGVRARSLTKDGRRIVCEWTSTPLRRRDGAYLGTLSMCQDVTERQRADEERSILVEELRAANRLKSDFVATMSHELRTPLNVILGYNDLLLEGAFGAVAPEQSSVIRRVVQSASELLELINATLDVSRLESGRVPLQRRHVRFAELIAQLDAETREAQQKSGVRVEWRIDDDLPLLFTDPVKLKVVLKNLFTNALKFTDQGSVIVSAEARDDGVEIRVADSGIGISAETLPIIFEPFRQADSSAARRHGGVGLGLYIVRRLVDILGGRIEVESEVGRGTAFRIWFPVVAEGEAAGPGLAAVG
jgi:PAS domain S-box-containing protein